jgi:hypothetical protein
VVFDETRFPFANTSIIDRPISCTDSTSFPQSEPLIRNDHVNRHNLSLLAPNPSIAGTGNLNVHGTRVHDAPIVQPSAASIPQHTTPPCSHAEPEDAHEDEDATCSQWRLQDLHTRYSLQKNISKQYNNKNDCNVV